MNNIKNITNPLERRRVQFGYSQQVITKLLGITQSQYSRIEKGDTDPNKHLKNYQRSLVVNLMRFFKVKY